MTTDAITRAGRLTSIASYVACLVPVWFALDVCHVQWEHRLITLSLMLVSPYYVYWSRCCTIETTALFFNLSYLAACMNGAWLVAIPFGIVGALVKANAWPTYAAGAVGFTLTHAAGNYWDRVGFSLAVWLPTFAGWLWLRHGDRVKFRHPLARRTMISSSNVQRRWNCGTWWDRLEWGQWRIVLAHAEPIMCIPPLFLLALAVVLTLEDAKRGGEMLVCVGLWLTGPLLNFGVTREHSYYQCASGIFLVGAVGFGVVGLLERGTP